MKKWNDKLIGWIFNIGLHKIPGFSEWLNNRYQEEREELEELWYQKRQLADIDKLTDQQIAKLGEINRRLDSRNKDPNCILDSWGDFK
jgi:hypothetical protein